MCKESSLKVKNFIKSTELQQFYMTDIEKLLIAYEPGNIKYKQDVLDEIKRRDNERAQSNNTNVNIIKEILCKL